MKVYYFTSGVKEYKVLAKNLHTALEQLVDRLLLDNLPFRIDPYYYCGSARRIPAKLYQQYLSGYSF